MSRVIALVAGVFTAAHQTASVAASAAERPNFLILFVDDLGYNEINLGAARPSTGGYTGYGGRVQTPNLAKFAEEGMTFVNWYSAWHCCSGSRSAMMTGRLPPRVGVDSVGGGVFTASAAGGLPLNETTFAEVLKGNGYRTGMLGKWHLGVRPQFLPNSRGFNYYLGIPFSADMGTSVWRPQPANNFDWAPQPLVEGTDTDGWKIIEQPAALQNLTVRYADAARTFITESSGTGKPPWVLYVSFNHVHNPQYCNAQWCGTASGVVGSGVAIPTGHGGTGSAVQEMDWTVGEIMAALKTAGVDDNTVVFFTSDNGAPSNHVAVQDEHGSNAPLRGYKGQVWEGGIRMPAMVRWPGRVRAGSISTELVATYDIFVTMVAMAGAALPTGRVYDGIDISPVFLENPGAAGHDCIFNYQTGRNLAVVRCGKWKVHFDTKDGPTLYNLDVDIGESNPIPANSTLWSTVVANITSIRTAFLATVESVADQVLIGDDRNYALCAAPNSTARYPDLPNCTLTPKNWIPPWPAPPPPAPVLPTAIVGCFWDKGYPDHGGKMPCDLPIAKSGHCPVGAPLEGSDEALARDDVTSNVDINGEERTSSAGSMTLELCQSLCNGHLYFGLQNGGTGCFCGASYGRYGPSSNCTMACTGDAKEICGGPGCNSVYRTHNTSDANLPRT